MYILKCYIFTTISTNRQKQQTWLIGNLVFTKTPGCSLTGSLCDSSDDGNMLNHPGLRVGLSL